MTERDKFFREKIVPLLISLKEKRCNLFYQAELRLDKLTAGQYVICNDHQGVALDGLQALPDCFSISNRAIVFNFDYVLRQSKRKVEIFSILAYFLGRPTSLRELSELAWPIMSPQHIINYQRPFLTEVQLPEKLNRVVFYDFDSCFSKHHVKDYFYEPSSYTPQPFSTPRKLSGSSEIPLASRVAIRGKEVVKELTENDEMVLVIVASNPDYHDIARCLEYELEQLNLNAVIKKACLNRVVICCLPWQKASRPPADYHNKNQQITWVLNSLHKRGVGHIENMCLVDDDLDNLQAFYSYRYTTNIKVASQSTFSVDLQSNSHGSWARIR